MPVPPILARRIVSALLLGAVWCAWLVAPGLAAGEDGLDGCEPEELRLYLALAEASALAYDDSQAGLEQTPSGCVALIREDADGNLVIAFRGSMLGDRASKHRFSSFGGANIRRNYRDWVATNLKQSAGFLPHQYVEAAALVEEHVRRHPVGKRVYITGHSKGGGAAAYAYVAACLSSTVSIEQARRMRCVTYNAAVVREQNWRRLFRGLERGAGLSGREPAAGSIHALVMNDDPVSKIAAAEERRYVKRLGIPSTIDRTPNEQHGIQVVIDELRRRQTQPGRIRK